MDKKRNFKLNKPKGASKTYIRRILRTTGDRKPQNNHKSQEADD